MKLLSNRMMGISYKFMLTCGVLIALLGYQIIAAGIVSASGNDFAHTELRVDLASVYNSKDYQELINTTAKPAAGTASLGYTTGWLSVDLAAFNGSTYSAQFTQVGIITDEYGPRWFVYAEPGVQCLSGSANWGTLGCIGAYNARVGLGIWTKVELVTYNQGFWILRVYDQNNSPLDVAKVWSTSTRIYRANASSEEAWGGSSDPHLTANFFHHHPKYINSGWQEWPAFTGTSPSTNNVAGVSPSSICPTYFGVQRGASDFRYFFLGSFANPPGAPFCGYFPIF